MTYASECILNFTPNLTLKYNNWVNVGGGVVFGTLGGLTHAQ